MLLNNKLRTNREVNRIVIESLLQIRLRDTVTSIRVLSYKLSQKPLQHHNKCSTIKKNVCIYTITVQLATDAHISINNRLDVKQSIYYLYQYEEVQYYIDLYVVVTSYNYKFVGVESYATNFTKKKKQRTKY